MGKKFFEAYMTAKKSGCNMEDFSNVNNTFFKGKISFMEYAKLMNRIENKKFFYLSECAAALEEHPIDEITFEVPQMTVVDGDENVGENPMISVLNGSNEEFATIKVTGTSIEVKLNSIPTMQDQQEIVSDIDVWIQNYVYSRYPETVIERDTDIRGNFTYKIKQDAIENAGPIQMPSGGDNGFSGVRNGSGDAIVGQKKPVVPEEESESSETVIVTFGEGNEPLLATKEQFLKYRFAKKDGKYNMLDYPNVVKTYFGDTPITQDEYLDIISRYNDYLVKYQDVTEGVLGAIAGGVLGITIGPSIGKAVASAFGCTKGPFYDFLTSRAFTTVLGAYIGGKK